MALAVVLGLILLMGLVVSLVFLVTLQNGRLVAKGWKELQSRSLGRAGLSWAISHLEKEPMGFGEPVARIWLDPERAGFEVDIRPHGLYLAIRVRPLGQGIDTGLVAWAEVGRGIRGVPPPALILSDAGDYKVMQGGGFEGRFSLPRGLFSWDPAITKLVKARPVDSQKVDEGLWNADGLDMAALWDSVAGASLATGAAVDSSRSQTRLFGDQTIRGKLRERSEIHVRGRLVLRDVECLHCVILAETIVGAGRGDLEASVVWSSGMSVWTGEWDGDGQILSGDTLLLRDFKGSGKHMLYASLGRGDVGKDSLSSSHVVLRKAEGRGWILAPGLGAGAHDNSCRLSVDSLSDWGGGWATDGVVENAGYLVGTLRAGGVFRRAPDGVVWGGQTVGRIKERADSTRWVLPWTRNGAVRSVAMRRWLHERE